MVARWWGLVGILCLSSCAPSRPLPVYSLDPPYDLPADRLLHYAEPSEPVPLAPPLPSPASSGCHSVPMSGLSAVEGCRPPALGCPFPSP